MIYIAGHMGVEQPVFLLCFPGKVIHVRESGMK